jgi:hypothetical protein
MSQIVSPSFSSGAWGAWSVATKSIVPSQKRLPQRLLVAFLPDRRVHPHQVPPGGEALGVEIEILRQRLDGDVAAATLPEADERDRGRAAFVHDVDARAGPVGERRGPVQRLDRHHIGARGQMRQRIGAPGRLHLVLPPEQDRRVLRMDRTAQAQPGEDLEALQHRAVRGAGLSPVVLPRNSFVPIMPASAIGRSWSRLCSPSRP